MGLDFGAVPSGSLEAGSEAEPPKEQKSSDPVGYSPIFRLGFLLSVPLSPLPSMLLTGLTTMSYITANDSSCQPRHRRRQNQNPQAEVASAVNLLIGKCDRSVAVAVLLFCCSLHETRLSQHTFLLCFCDISHYYAFCLLSCNLSNR